MSNNSTNNSNFLVSVPNLFNDKEYRNNNNRKTYCQGNFRIYHDSEYFWCRVCNQIFCTSCSYSHIMNHQIDHSPVQSVLLRKEELDIEFYRNYGKMKELEKIISNILEN